MAFRRPMQPGGRHSNRVRIKQQASAVIPERITCRICNFPGVNYNTSPGGEFPTALVVTGTIYSWTNANDSIALIDKVVTPVPNVGSSCPACGGTMFLSGSRGEGQ